MTQHLIQKNKPQTCLAAARISTTKQVRGHSLQEQVKDIENYAREQGLSILPDGVVAQEVHTGAKSRPVYEQHIQYIKDHPGTIGYYVIYVIDRFSRGGDLSYKGMKKELAELGVTLIDVYGIIQPPENHHELQKLGFEYEWSVRSKSEMAETMLAVHAEQERLDILTRTIPKQIQYTQMGFQVGRPHDGYLNKQIQHGTQLRYTQSPDPDRAHFIRKIFELRCENKMTDKEIIKYLNDAMGYRSKLMNKWNKQHTEIIGKGGGRKLTLKQLHRILERVSYAGLKCEKWTYNKPIRAMIAEPLVSIRTFNQANRGKVFIQEYPDGSLEILNDYYGDKPKPYKRRMNNPDYPFKCIQCPICRTKDLKGSASTGRNKTRHPVYHCSRGHERFSVKHAVMDNTIENFLSLIHYNPKYLKSLEDFLASMFRRKQSKAIKTAQELQERIALLNEKKKQALEKILETSSTSVLQMLEKRIEEIDNEIKIIERQCFTEDTNEDQIPNLMKYLKKIVEHPKKTLLDKANPIRQRKLLELLFDPLPTYAELASGTAQLALIFKALNGIHTLQKGGKSQMGSPLGLEWNQFEDNIISWTEQARLLFDFDEYKQRNLVQKKSMSNNSITIEN